MRKRPAAVLLAAGLCGYRAYRSSTEQAYQLQYDFYKASDSRVTYWHSATGTVVWWWLRSACCNSKLVPSLNTNLAGAVVPAGLAAMTKDKRGTETVFQVVLWRGFAPSPVSADLSDPHATWLEVILGSVSKATAKPGKQCGRKRPLSALVCRIREPSRVSAP